MRYVAVAVTALAAEVALGILARLSVLSAPIYAVASIGLLGVAVAALYLGTRRDEREDRSGPDNDY